jgi:superfamily I DNA/RNA helicase
MADFTSESGEHFGYLRMDYQAMLTGKKYLTPQQEYRIFANKALKGTEPLEFNYGYAITGHRAQGSEWGKVLAFEENFPFNSEEHRRWLYTVATRAQDKLVLITESEGVYAK